MPHILLVDDDEDLCHMLGCLLKEEGHTVTIAPDGFAALLEFRKQLPDLILLDLMLPKIDGIEVCWRTRALSNIPIIIISAKDRDIDILSGLKAGANDYIPKPFDVDEIPARINFVLNCT